MELALRAATWRGWAMSALLEDKTFETTTFDEVRQALTGCSHSRQKIRPWSAFGRWPSGGGQIASSMQTSTAS